MLDSCWPPYWPQRSWEGPFPRPSGRKRRKNSSSSARKTATPNSPVVSARRSTTIPVAQVFSESPRSLQSDQYRAPSLTNSPPRIDQLIHDGKLELSMQEAVELALENSMGHRGANATTPGSRTPASSRRSAGGFGGATPGAFFAGSTANNPLLNYDPVVTTTIKALTTANIQSTTADFRERGQGLLSLTRLTLHTKRSTRNMWQGFQTGSQLLTAWDNTRSSQLRPPTCSTLPCNLLFSSDSSNSCSTDSGVLSTRENIRIARTT